MITEKHLLKLDFEKDEELENVYNIGQYKFSLEDGAIRYIQEGSNYEGISVDIQHINSLQSILKVLPLK